MSDLSSTQIQYQFLLNYIPRTSLKFIRVGRYTNYALKGLICALKAEFLNAPEFVSLSTRGKVSNDQRIIFKYQLDNF